MKALWTTQGVTFDGTYFSVRDLTMAPSPVQDQHPPIWIGQDTAPKTLDVVADTADAVNMHARSPSHADRKMTRIERTCNEIGRDTEEIVPVLKHFVVVDPSETDLKELYRDEAHRADTTPAEYVSRLKSLASDGIIGTPAECREQYRAFIDAGYTHFTPIVLPNYGDHALRNMRLFAETVKDPLQRS